jgi:hypothetical protein
MRETALETVCRNGGRMKNIGVCGQGDRGSMRNRSPDCRLLFAFQRTSYRPEAFMTSQ